MNNFRNEFGDEDTKDHQVISDANIFEAKIKDKDIADLNATVRQRTRTRRTTQAYESFKKTIAESPDPSQVRLNRIQRSRTYNLVRNLRAVQLAKSLVRKFADTFRPEPSSESIKSEQLDASNSKPAVHQFVPVLAPRDAIGSEIIAIRNMLRKSGYRSDILVEVIHPEMYKDSRKFTEYEVSSSNDVIIYHMASYSKLVDSFRSLPVRKVMIYHNITPHDYFINTNYNIAKSCGRARKQLNLLKYDIELAITHSEYSKMELAKIGFKNIVVAPVYLNFDKYKGKLKCNLMRRYANSTNILYVGRIAPHKKIEDLLQIFAYYNTCIDSNSNLFIVGNFIGTERYYTWLQKLIRNANIRKVHFIQNANEHELITYYNLADVYVSMSEHEGFCIPLVESMYFGVPIIAYDSTSVPYTLANAGIRVKEKYFEEIAELIDLIVNDDGMKTNIIKEQNERLDAIKQNNTLADTLTMFASSLEMLT
ncbi:MAG: glycosyltransferase [Nitrososphaerales archaeon]